MTKPVTIELPENVAADAVRAAQAAGESLDVFVARAVAFEVEREHTERVFAERRSRADIEKALKILGRKGGQPPADGDKLG
jgi:hypothetical protein